MNDGDWDSHGARDSTRGAGAVNTVRATGAAIQDEDWGELAAASGVLALDGLATVVDPVGTLLAAGVGWLIEHVDPLTQALDKLAGDPAAIQAAADTWTSVQIELENLAGEVPRMVGRDLPGWEGLGRDKYDAAARNMADGVTALAMSAGNAASVVATSGTMVATCRAIVRDIVAAIIAELIKGALAALATSVVSFGTTVAGYIAYAAGRIGMTVAKIAGKISSLLAKLGTAGAHLAKVMDDIAAVGAQIGSRLGKAGGTVGDVAPDMGRQISSIADNITSTSVKLDGLGTTVGRGADRVSTSADNVGEFANRAGTLGSDWMASGRNVMDSADDVGQRAGEVLRNGPVPEGAMRDFGETAGLVTDGYAPNPAGVAARGSVYDDHYEQTNDREDIEEGHTDHEYDQHARAQERR